GFVLRSFFVFFLFFFSVSSLIVLFSLSLHDALPILAFLLVFCLFYSVGNAVFFASSFVGLYSADSADSYRLSSFPDLFFGPFSCLSDPVYLCFYSAFLVYFCPFFHPSFSVP